MKHHLLSMSSVICRVAAGCFRSWYDLASRWTAGHRSVNLSWWFVFVYLFALLSRSLAGGFQYLHATLDSSKETPSVTKGAVQENRNVSN